MLNLPPRPTVATHWGVYRARMEDGRPVALDPYEGDPDPSPMSAPLLDALNGAARVARPAVRRSFLEHGAAAGGAGRGAEPFVEVDWPTALDLVAAELARVRGAHGNAAIYGGSYGWSSAGRFHHAQSQLHRFLNAIGGFTRSVQNYSHGAAETILPYVIGDRRGLTSAQSSWRSLAGQVRLVVMFGGMPWRNAQVSSGGIARHGLVEGLCACRDGGARFVSVSLMRDDLPAGIEAEWIAPRPTTDVALMLGLAHTLLHEGLHDAAFLRRYTHDFDRVAAYLRGQGDGVAKSADWAAGICGIDADTIRGLARRMAAERTLITMAWSLQRADHGEQPYWMAVTLAAMLGQIGLPGGGFGFGYGAVNGVGNPVHDFAWPSLPQGKNPVEEHIPVARLADMLLHPGDPYVFEGRTRHYPHVRLVYWAGGNPFHHHQDLNRLLGAWRRPETVVVHEAWWTATARHADIVLPVTTPLERNDIACSARDRLVAASHRLAPPYGQARDDHAVFAELAARLGVGEAFTEGLDEEGWLRRLYASAADRVADAGMLLPPFDLLWHDGVAVLPEPARQPPLLEDFRADPQAHALATPSGRIELYSERIAAMHLPDCPGHAAWIEPREWLGGEQAARFPLHLVTTQPADKLHSQHDSVPSARRAKVHEREALRMHPRDAAARGLAEGDIVRVHNDRGACLAGVCLSESIRPGVVQMATGAWYDPLVPGEIGSLDKHGNPNVLTRDAGTSMLAQATAAQSCLVEVVRHDGALPPLGCLAPPPISPASA